MRTFFLPDLGEGLQEAEIREWYVSENDVVEVDQPMVAMETAKSVVDVPSPYSGKILKLHGKAGEMISTGAALVEFESSLDDATDQGTVVGRLEHEPAVIQEPPTHIKAPTATVSIKIIPAVRALAKKLNVDLSQVKPTGQQGTITSEDIERAAQSATAVQDGYERLRGIRRTMAMAMKRSHAEVVPVTIMDDADIHTWPIKTDITLRIIQAMLAACRVEPALNAWFDGESMARRLHDDVHLGLAMDSSDGLFVPVLKNVMHSSDESLREKINYFKQAVHARSLSPDELRGATIVLSNVGIFAGRYANPIIVPPTVAILATGRIYTRVVLEGERLTEYRMLPLSLSFDHRAITGGEAARFLTAIMQNLQQH